MFDIGRTAHHAALVEFDPDEMVVGRRRPFGHAAPLLRRLDTDSAWPCSPSASPRRPAAGPIRSSAAWSPWTHVVRFMQPRSFRPEAKRAAPDVGGKAAGATETSRTAS